MDTMDIKERLKDLLQTSKEANDKKKNLIKKKIQRLKNEIHKGEISIKNLELRIMKLK